MIIFLLFVIVVALLFGTKLGIAVFLVPLAVLIICAMIALVQRPKPQERPAFRSKADELDWANRRGDWA